MIVKLHLDGWSASLISDALLLHTTNFYFINNDHAQCSWNMCDHVSLDNIKKFVLNLFLLQLDVKEVNLYF